MSSKNMALRPYVENIEKICKELKKKELIALVVNMAKDVSPNQRRGYLENLQSHLSGRSGGRAGSQEISAQCRKIDALDRSIKARIEAIEDGSYWDDPDDDWEGEYDYDDDPDCLSGEHVAELAVLFREAGDLFERHNLKEAGQLYERLFCLVSEVENYGFMPDLEVDLREAHARYCRTVYELSPADERVTEVAKVMAVEQPQDDFGGLHGAESALLQDIIDAQTGTLPDIAQFLPEWEEFLSKKGHRPDRLARLRLEAAFLLHGLDGVQKLAQGWKGKQPQGYVIWLERLAGAQKWDELAEAAIEALSVLPMGSDRRYTAGFLMEAGRQCHDDNLILQGRREAFRSSTSETNLLHLVAEADRQQRREEEIQVAIGILRNERPRNYGGKSLLAKLFLMAGDLQSVAELCKKGAVYGWSGGSPEALLFCAVLYCDSKQGEKCQLLQDMFNRYCEESMDFDSYPADNEEPMVSFIEEIKRGLVKVDTTSDDFTKHIQPTMQNGEKRVDYIVSNKYRNAYGRAAGVLGAMAERLVCNGEMQQARALIHKYYFKKYNRFPAFRREVREAVESSPLLTGMGV